MEKILNSKTLFEMLENAVEKYSLRTLQSYREQDGIKNITYKEFFEKVKRVSSAFRKMGIKKGTKVLLISDNRYEWLIVDMALLSIGAVDVPRSSSSPESELSFIAKHSDSEFAIIEDEKLYQPIKGIVKQENVVVFNRSENFINFSALLKDDGNEYKKSDIDKDDLVTIIYTSGTTGNPKGVMLTHKNFMHNVSAITPLIKFKTYGKDGDVTVSILPVWHIFERTFEYVCIAGGAKIFYSNVKNFARDLLEIKPTIMSAVPRIWEHIYRKIIDRMKNEKVFKKTLFYLFLNIREKHLYSYRVLTNRDTQLYEESYKKRFFKILMSLIIFPLFLIPSLLAYFIFESIRDNLGGRLRGAFTGGGMIPNYIDNFFNTVGITLLNAYGMTEASPGITSRRFDYNFLFTAGIPFDRTEISLRDENGKKVKKGEKGIIHVKGDQVMKGYYKNEEETKKVLTEDGWLNTGDIGFITKNGNLIILGRAKDTIVLLGGENVEPQRIEEKLEENEFISHAVVVGDDEKDLAALIFIEEEKLKNLIKELKLNIDDLKEGIENIKVKEFFKNFLEERINRSKNFHPFESIKNFTIIPEKLQIGKEITETLKKKRKVIIEKYKTKIEEMYKKKK
ncbi:MAG: long-chain fatty acid--CoA ligase [candidate division WOR-3 bacterium]